ncbi:hypothetical protein [Klebsiella quasipneumoniae]
MAEAQVALDTNNDRSNHYSRPVFKQVLKVNSLQAQRVMERSFERVSNSLFSIDVILRIIGEQDEIDQVETVIRNTFPRSPKTWTKLPPSSTS